MTVAQGETVDLATRVGRLEGTVEQVLQRLKTLERQLSELCTELRSDIAEVRAEIAGVRSEITGMRAEIRWIAAGLAALFGALGFWW